MTIADRRLAPATLIERTLKLLPRIVLAMLPVVMGRDRLDWLPWVIVPLIAATIAYNAAALARFRYGFGTGEFVIERGVFSRQRRVIPVERIQDVELVRSPIARAIGLAKVRLETGAGGTDEGVLDSLRVADAEALRDQLRQARADSAVATAEPVPAEPIFAMTRGRVLLEGVFSPSLVFIAAIFGVLQNLEPVLGTNLSPERWLGRGARAAESITVARGAALALAAVLLGFLTGIARAAARNHGFTLTRADRGLRLRRGLFTTAEAVVPLVRVQAMVLRDGPARRVFGWARLELQTLGFGSGRTNRLAAAPFAREHEIARVLGAIDPAPHAPVWRRVSPRFVTRAGLRFLLVALLAACAGVFWPPAALIAVLLAVLGTAQAAMRWRVHGFAITDDTLYVRRGWLGRERWIVPLRNAQAFALLRSSLQRRLGLASIAVDTAGSAGRYRPRVVDLPVAEAQALLATLRAASRARRTAARAAQAGLSAVPRNASVGSVLA